MTVTETAPLESAIDLMESRNIKRLPVMRGDRVVGIVTRANLMRALATALRRRHHVANESDNKIRARIVANLAK